MRCLWQPVAPVAVRWNRLGNILTQMAGETEVSCCGWSLSDFSHIARCRRRAKARHRKQCVFQLVGLSFPLLKIFETGVRLTDHYIFSILYMGNIELENLICANNARLLDAIKTLQISSENAQKAWAFF